jgi:hypothetical protein
MDPMEPISNQFKLQRRAKEWRRNNKEITREGKKEERNKSRRRD